MEWPTSWKAQDKGRNPKSDETHEVVRPHERRSLTSKDSSRPECLRGSTEERRVLYLQNSREGNCS